MRKLIASCAVVGMILAVAVPGQAVTFKFDPNELIQSYPASAGSDVAGGRKADQPNARRTHQPWGTAYETFYNNYAGGTYAKTQPDSYNTYMNWRDGLGTGEGISAFNIWLLDNPYAKSWGETTVWDPHGTAPTGTADAAGKWKVQVTPTPTSWGLPGFLVQWWTDDSSNYINTLSDIGEFSFSGTAYHDNNANGYDAPDPEVQAGETARIWFGAVNWTESDGTYDWSLHFDDQGWGNRTPNDGGPWSAGLTDSKGYGSGYEGVLAVAAVPEPSMIILLGSLVTGLFGTAGIRKRFKRQA